MKESKETKQAKRLIVFGVLFAALVYLIIRFVVAVFGIMILFGMVALIVIVLNPAVGWLERHRVPRPLSASVLAFLVLGVVGVIVWIAVPPAISEVTDFLGHLPDYLARAQEWISRHSTARGIPVGSKNPSQTVQMFYEHAGSLLSGISTYALSGVEIVGSAFVVFISVIYSLASPRPIVEGLLRLFAPEQSQRVADIMTKIGVQMRQWAFSVVLDMFLAFAMVWVLLGPILHMPFAFLFALVAGIFEIIPAVGPILGGVAPLLVALSEDPVKAIWVVVGFTIIQQVESHVVVPMVLSRGVRLHPVSVVFAVLVMGVLFGIIGVFLAVPLLAVTKTLIEDIYLASKEAGEKPNVSEDVEQIVSGQVEEEKPPEP